MPRLDLNYSKTCLAFACRISYSYLCMDCLDFLPSTTKLQRTKEISEIRKVLGANLTKANFYFLITKEYSCWWNILYHRAVFHAYYFLKWLARGVGGENLSSFNLPPPSPSGGWGVGVGGGGGAGGGGVVKGGGEGEKAREGRGDPKTPSLSNPNQCHPPSSPLPLFLKHNPKTIPNVIKGNGPYSLS